MKCAKCSNPIQLNHRPGIFFGVASFAATTAVGVGVVFSSLMGLGISAGLALVAVLSMCGVWAEMVDASAPVFSKRGEKGVECCGCGHINRIYPWLI